jgi:hypothetical protein
MFSTATGSDRLDWQASNRMGAQGSHRFRAEQFGLTIDQIRFDYEFYFRRFDVAVENER